MTTLPVCRTRVARATAAGVAAWLVLAGSVRTAAADEPDAALAVSEEPDATAPAPGSGEPDGIAPASGDDARATAPVSSSDPLATTPVSSSDPVATTPDSAARVSSSEPDAPAPVPASDRSAPAPVESNVISLAGREGFRFATADDGFVLQPYLLLQIRGQLRWVDDEGLELADRDNVVDAGFGFPAAVLGFAGRAFSIISYNLTLDLACGGQPCLLNQAWVDVAADPLAHVRLGKLKTPMHRARLVRLGGTQLPLGPAGLGTQVNLPLTLSAVNPVFATGFDIGLMLHGDADWFRYEIGVFNGEGVNVNVPTSTLDDDSGVPALLYGARVQITPFGSLPLDEGGPDQPRDFRLMAAASVSYNVETNAESSRDLRGGLELVLAGSGVTATVEAYLMHMEFLERLSGTPSYLFWGAYAQVGYITDVGLEPVVRFEVFDRNSVDVPGLLVLPSVGLAWYIIGRNTKLQVMYQYLLSVGHEDAFAAQDDDNSMAEHTAVLQFQFVL